MNHIERAITLTGGPAALARSLGVSVQAVCFWRDGKRTLPLDQCPYIERLTSGVVTCEQLRPDKVEYFDLLRQRATPSGFGSLDGEPTGEGAHA